MYILTLSPDGEEGAFTVLDEDGEDLLYLFEEKDDATRFAIQLEEIESDDFSVDVVEVDDEMIIKVCEFNETQYSIITKNDIVTPPNYLLIMLTFETIRWKNFLSTGNHFTEMEYQESNNFDYWSKRCRKVYCS